MYDYILIIVFRLLRITASIPEFGFGRPDEINSLQVIPLSFDHEDKITDDFDSAQHLNHSPGMK